MSIDRAPIQGRIQKISVGPDPLNCLTFKVGQPIKIQGVERKVSEIVRNEANFHLYGAITYIIYIQGEDESQPTEWKFFENVPISCSMFVEVSE